MTENKAKRSGCLTAFLIILIVIYALGALGSFAVGPLMQSLGPEYASTMSNPWVSAVLAVLSIIFLLAVWRFKKWGFWGFAAVAALNIIFSLYLGGGLLDILLILLFPVILFLLIRPIWNYMG